MQQFHDAPVSGHLGQAKTLERLQRGHFWPHMSDTVKLYVRTCDACQRNKKPNQLPLGLLQPLPIPATPWDSISLDFTDMPRSRQGYDSMMVCVDRLTKMLVAIPTTRTVTGPGAAQLFVDHVLRRGYGLPRSLVSDRDPRFTGHFWRGLQAQLGVRLDLSSPAHPQTDGQTERANRTLKEVLRAFVNTRQDDWDLQLPLAEFAYNDSVHAGTGCTPFFANLGRHPRLPQLAGVEPGPCESANEFAARLAREVARIKQQLRAA
jgi:hypothetical protein